MATLPEDLFPGCQIAYIPHDALGDIDHPHVQYGFVTSVRPEYGLAYCRFWQPEFMAVGTYVLRTKSASEAVGLRYIVRFESAPAAAVQTVLGKLQEISNHVAT